MRTTRWPLARCASSGGRASRFLADVAVTGFDDVYPSRIIDPCADHGQPAVQRPRRQGGAPASGPDRRPGADRRGPKSYRLTSSVPASCDCPQQGDQSGLQPGRFTGELPRTGRRTPMRRHPLTSTWPSPSRPGAEAQRARRLVTLAALAAYSGGRRRPTCGAPGDRHTVPPAAPGLVDGVQRQFLRRGGLARWTRNGPMTPAPSTTATVVPLTGAPARSRPTRLDRECPSGRQRPPAITPVNSGGRWTSGRIETVADNFAAPAGGELEVFASIRQPTRPAAWVTGRRSGCWAPGSGPAARARPAR